MAVTSSNQLVEHQDNNRWYVETQEWFESHDISINALLPFQYIDCPHLKHDQAEKNGVIQTDMIKLDKIRT